MGEVRFTINPGYSPEEDYFVAAYAPRVGLNNNMTLNDSIIHAFPFLEGKASAWFYLDRYGFICYGAD